MAALFSQIQSLKAENKPQKAKEHNLTDISKTELFNALQESPFRSKYRLLDLRTLSKSNIDSNSSPKDVIDYYVNSLPLPEYYAYQVDCDMLKQVIANESTYYPIIKSKFENLRKNSKGKKKKKKKKNGNEKKDTSETSNNDDKSDKLDSNVMEFIIQLTEALPFDFHKTIIICDSDTDARTDNESKENSNDDNKNDKKDDSTDTKDTKDSKGSQHVEFLKNKILVGLCGITYCRQLKYKEFVSFVEKYSFLFDSFDKCLSQANENENENEKKSDNNGISVNVKISRFRFNKYPSEILENRLWLGNETQLRNVKMIRDELKISHILSIIEKDISDVHKEYNSNVNNKNKIATFTVAIEDIPSESIDKHLNDCFQFIDKSGKDGKVFVHCEQGISRSGSAVIAYVMKTKQMSFENALKFVQQRRPRVSPNEGFVKQLQEFEKQLNLQQNSK